MSPRAHELDTRTHESCVGEIKRKGKVDGGVKSKGESDREEERSRGSDDENGQLFRAHTPIKDGHGIFQAQPGWPYSESRRRLPVSSTACFRAPRRRHPQSHHSCPYHSAAD